MDIFGQLAEIEKEIPNAIEINLEEDRKKAYAIQLLNGEVPEDLGHLTTVELKQYQIKNFGAVIQV